MGLFSSSSDSKGAHLVLDIGSGHAGAALIRYVSVKGKRVPEILASTSRPIALEENTTFKTFLAGAMKSLSRSLAELQKTHPQAIRSVHCFFSSPWYAAEIRNVVLEKKTPFTVTKRILDELYTKEVRMFTEETLGRYKEAGETARLIEQKITAVYLNGYSVANAVGKRAKSIEMNIYLAVSPELVLAAVEETVAKVFHSRKIQFHSFTLAAYTVARDTLITVPDFLLVDVGGEVTDFLLVKKGVVSGIASFPYGRTFLYRSIAAKYASSLQDAQTMLSLYVAGTLEESKRLALERLFTETESEWLRAFQKALQLAEKEPGMAPTIVLSGSADTMPFFENILKSEDFHRYSLDADSFSVIPLREELMRPHVNASPGSAAGASSMIESMFINSILS